MWLTEQRECEVWAEASIKMMSPVLVVLTAYVCTPLLHCPALGHDTPPNQHLTSRVVNGVEAWPHSWPWQISLQEKSYGRWKHVCGGSLIAANWVMTAARCINTTSLYRVLVGKHDLAKEENGSKAILPEKIIVHERWNPESVTSGYDIALIKLSESVTLSRTVRLARIPPAGTLLPNRYPCYITGWGKLSTNGTLADKLQRGLLRVVDYDTCSRRDWWSSSVKPNMMCAGGNRIVSACNGDFGGPLNCWNRARGWQVHGIASFVSSRGCNYKKPTVFTCVSALYDWISHIKETDDQN